MSNFEHAELSRSPEPSSSDLTSQAFLADIMPPFKVAMKNEAKPIVLAGNDSRSGCSTPDVPPIDTTPKPVEQQAPVQNTIDFRPQMSQQQTMEQYQNQAQQAEALARAQAVNKTDVTNSDMVNSTVDGKMATTIGDTNLSNANGLTNQIDGSSRNIVNVGGNTYKSSSYARGESLPGNQCQSFAIRGDVNTPIAGGGIGYSSSNEACLNAIAVKADCDGTETMGRANLANSAAEQSWLKVATPAQKEEIIRHGIGNAQHISDNVVKKSADCARGQKEETAPPAPEQKTVVVNQGNFATKEDLKALEQRGNSKLDAAFAHGLKRSGNGNLTGMDK